MPLPYRYSLKVFDRSVRQKMKPQILNPPVMYNKSWSLIQIFVAEGEAKWVRVSLAGQE